MFNKESSLELSSPEDASAIKKRQVDMLFRHLPTIYLADFVTGAFLALVLSYIEPRMSIYVWYTILCLVTLVRVYMMKALRDGDYDVDAKLIFLYIGAFFSGTIWGCSWLTITGDPSFFQISLVGLWVSGMLAGAAATTSIIKSIFFAFAIPSAAFLLIFLAIFVDENRLLYSSSFLMYLCFIVPISMGIGKDLNKAIRLEVRNSHLQIRLKEDALRLKEREEDVQVREGLETNGRTGETLEKKSEADSLILNSINEGIYGINTHGKISFINESALQLLGFEQQDVIGRPAHKLINRFDSTVGEDTRPNLAISNSFRVGATLQNVDSVFAGKDGLSLPVRFSCKPVLKQSNVIGAVVSFSDLSKQKEMESMLLQAQKMEAIGRLTGGISHDFNNLLTVIMGNIHFLQRHLESDKKATALLGKIMHAAKSGAELSNRLLSFSREQALVKKPLDVVEMLYDMRDFLSRILGEEISLEVQHSGKRCIAMTDRNQLENAIFNLCINAKDAMPNGGKLTIVTRPNRSTDGQEMIDVNRVYREYVVISIADTGMGMSEEVQKNIFDPFFTTKEKNRGTGLGLSSVYGFVKQTGGSILVNSRVDVGTTFTLFIPSAQAHQLPEEISKPPRKSLKKHQGTILVVEDDTSVLAVAKQMLVESGFSVISATDGPSGINEYETHRGEIDLVFSDVVMPGGMTGIELAQKILEYNPNLPIVMATGYTDKVLKDSIDEANNVVFVAKPYDTYEIPELISSMVEDARVH